jgi:AcrR family transcriptional regulator
MFMTTAEKKTPVRERIVDTACDLFYRQGYRATGINQVISESGVAKASFYDHFHSKDELLLEYVRETSRREIADIREQVSAYTTVEDRLYGPFRMLVPWFTQTDFRGCPMQNILAEIPPGNEDVHRILTRHRDQKRAFLLELIEDYLAENGPCPQIDCEALAETFLLLFAGAIAVAASRKELWPVVRGEESLRRFFE